MSTVRYYRWDDAGAPVLSGQVGALNAVLRACLVGTSGIAYGSKPSAGWSEAFIGAASNIAAFRNNPADGASGCYVRVNDNAPGSAGARESQIQAFASMSDINTGVNETASPWIRKSSTADATARRWLVVADGMTAWIYTYCLAGASSEGFGRDTTLAGFGDYACVDAANAFRFFAMGRSLPNYSRLGPAIFDGASPFGNDDGFTTPSLDGISALLKPSLSHPVYYTNLSHGLGGTFSPASPHAITGDNYFHSNPTIHVRAGGVLGRLRGLVLPYQTIIGNTEGVEFPGFAGQIVVKTRIQLDWTNNEVGACLLLDSLGPWP